MNPLHLILAGVVLPACVAGGTLALFWKLGRFQTPTQARAAGATAFVAAYIIGYIALLGEPPFPFQPFAHWLVGLFIPGKSLPPSPPLQSAQWLFWCVWLPGLLDLRWIPHRSRRPVVPGRSISVGTPPTRWNMPARWLVRAVVSGLAIYLQLQGKFRTEWAGATGLAWFGLLLILALILWLCVEHLGAPGSWPPFTLMGFGVLLSLNLLFSGSAVLAEMAGILTAICGAVWVLSSWARALDWRDVSPEIAVLVTGLLLNGCFYSDLPAVNVWLLLGALAAGAAAWRWLPSSVGPRWRNVLRTGIVLGLAGLALFLAARTVSLSDYNE